MSQATYLEKDPNTDLEPDEIEALEDERAEKRERRRLLEDKPANYGMVRVLVPIISSDSLGAMAFIRLYSFSDFSKKIMLFQRWHTVEGGKIQVREKPNDTAEGYGYAVVRSQDDPGHDFYLRVFNDEINSVIILPRSDEPLPHHGQQKSKIMEQMQMVPIDEIHSYTMWLERMKKVK